MIKSSLPLNSPLITTDLPMFTMVLSTCGVGRGAATATSVATGCTDGALGVAVGGGGAGRTFSSRFHIATSPHCGLAQGDHGQIRFEQQAGGPVYARLANSV